MELDPALQTLSWHVLEFLLGMILGLFLLAMAEGSW